MPEDLAPAPQPLPVALPSNRTAPWTGPDDDLPPEVTSFVGRCAELSSIRTHLAAGTRLVTLIGVGGVGKSRLALRAARMLRPTFPDGVRSVDLTSVRQGELVVHAVAESVGVDAIPGVDPGYALVRGLAGKEMLVVLDNCDHLLRHSSDLVGFLLRSTRAITVLATSRAPLGVSGEQIFPVPALFDADTAEGGRDAVQLFSDRVHAVRPGFAVTDANREAVLALCRRLDGLPLAIELAARRMRVLSLTQLSQRLEDRFHLLTEAPRDAPDRHRSLLAVLDLSFEQCTPVERVLWARASIFVAGATLDALESVCAGGPVSQDAVLDVVDGLVQRSVLSQYETPAGPRYRMLEAVREYGLRRLPEVDGQAPALRDVRRRHRAYYGALAGRAERAWFGPHQDEWSTRLRSELPNVRAALENLEGADQSGSAMAMVADLWPLWVACGLLHEGRLWTRRALETSPAEAPGRARALWVSGWISLLEGDLADATARLSASSELATASGDDAALAFATGLQGAAAGFSGDLDTAVGLYERAVRINQRTGDVPGRAVLLYQLAEMYCVAGRLEQAVQCARECRELCEPHGERWCSSYAVWVQGLALYLLGDYDGATDLARLAMRTKRQLNDRLGLMLVGELLAWSAVSAGRLEQGSLLLGAAGGSWDSVGCQLMGFQGLMHHHERSVAVARKALGPTGFQTVWEQGAALPEDAMVELAVSGQMVREAPPGPAGAPARGSRRVAHPQKELAALTRREREVAALIAEGLTNRQIARRLVIGQRTAETHVANILSKCGLQRRGQLAGWLATRQEDG